MKRPSIKAGTSRLKRLANCLAVLFLVAMSPSRADWSTMDFRTPSSAGDPAAAVAMRDLATRLIPVYQESDPDRYLANLSALQMVAGNYAAADMSRQSLRERREHSNGAQPVGRAVIYDLYAHAKAMEAESDLPFAQAFAKAYLDVVPRLSDQDAYSITEWLGAPPAQFRDALQKLFDQQRARDSVGQSDAVDLIWAYLIYDAYRSFGPLVGSLDADDDRRRYAVDDHVVIEAPGGAHIAAVVVRPKNPSKPIPTLLEFTIYDARNYAKECAAHGYAGVVAYTRGVRSSPHSVVPYQHDGDDARTVIHWIAKQSWSDGRVGMYGDGYSGFAAWAAAKHPPPALKAIAASGASAPGVDVPMTGNIFHNSAYRWSSYVTNTKASDEKDYYDDACGARWIRSGMSVEGGTGTCPSCTASPIRSSFAG